MNSRTMVADEHAGALSDASPVQPTTLEFIVVLVICSMVSFRIFALIAVPFVFVAFCRSRRAVLRYLALAAMAGLFAIPVDLRFASS